VPDGIPVYVGSYGPSGDVAQQVAELPNGRYAPMFALQEAYYREQRRVPSEQADKLDPRFAGAVPPLARLGSTTLRVSWGVELGSRYRDQIRQTQDAGFVVDSWQFDEIVPSAARADGALREFLRGVFRGLVFGRPQLEDPTVQRLVWVAHSALALARLGVTSELTTFWNMLNRAAFGYVGEEYPPFDGNPRTVARVRRPRASARSLRGGRCERPSLASTSPG
jgi:hypothetical protein